jgi:hypothetical protein
MSVVAKGPPYMTEDEALYYKGFGVHKPIIPEVGLSEERLRDIGKLEWKKIDMEQAARDWWFDSEFLDGTTVREVLEQEKGKARSEQVGGTHYSDLSIQPWDAMRAWFTPAEYASYHIGTVIGYLSRHRRKGGLNDIKKAHHHLSELIRYFEEEEEYE